MKIKIAAAVLAAVLLFHVCGEYTRARAEVVSGVIITIGVLAFNLIGVMSGQYDDVAEGIGCFIENGVEGWQKAFVGTEDTPSWFVSGWQQIYDTCSSWFESGAITIDGDGKVHMTYSQYLELFDLVGQAHVEFNINLVTDIPYISLKAKPGFSYKLDWSMCIADGSTEYRYPGISYAQVFYDDEAIYFSTRSLNLSFYKLPNTDDGISKSLRFQGVTESLNNSDIKTLSGNGSYYGYDFIRFFDIWNINLTFGTNYLEVYTNKSPNGSDYQTYKENFDHWIRFDGQTKTFCSPDLSGMDMAIINCKGLYSNFLKDICSYSVVGSAPVLDDLSDPLKDILTKTSDPTLVIDPNPAIVSPEDAVIITDVPGVADVTLAQLKAKTRLDINVPSVIVDKFPFCLPFDFIRIISVLCADPKAPVFRIPISTNSENLAPFEGNQTIGDVPEDFNPLFEIDEEIVIDLSCIPLVQPICYSVFIIGFVVLLIYLTPKMINH